MARPRSDTATLAREGHNISLKVLRLSRPSLAQQYPIPKSNIAGIPQTASLAYPSSSIDGDFILTPILSLPPAFGSVYVGETFSCAIVANNELDPSGTNGKTISGLRLAAEIQTPSQSFPLELYASTDAENDSLSGTSDREMEAGSSLQRIVEFPLREEGNHTLIIGVSYHETVTSNATAVPKQVGDRTPSTSSDIAPGADQEKVHQPVARTRTFRKMYQFPTTPCLSVRTKATELPSREAPEKSPGDPYGRTSLLRYALEAQLENVSDMRITLERAVLVARPPFKAWSLNDGLDSSSSFSSQKGDEKEEEEEDNNNGDIDSDSDSDSDDNNNDGNETKQQEENGANSKSTATQRGAKINAIATDKKKQQRWRGQTSRQIVLQPRSIHQLLFHLVQQANVTTGLDELKANLFKADGRIVLGQLALEWQSSMGERGALSTGNLMSRRGASMTRH